VKITPRLIVVVPLREHRVPYRDGSEMEKPGYAEYGYGYGHGVYGYGYEV
jgi:hypothetical protein